MLDLKHTVDLVERQSGGLDIEVPDERYPECVQDGENDVEAPADVLPIVSR